MLKHIVMWKLKDQAEGGDRVSNALQVKQLLDACQNLVPGLLKLEVAVATAPLEATYDVVLYSEFSDRAALAAYQVHPTHKTAAAFIGAVRLERQCMDYEV